MNEPEVRYCTRTDGCASPTPFRQHVHDALRASQHPLRLGLLWRRAHIKEVNHSSLAPQLRREPLASNEHRKSGGRRGEGHSLLRYTIGGTLT
jgi:hypothetical protein